MVKTKNSSLITAGSLNIFKCVLNSVKATLAMSKGETKDREPRSIYPHSSNHALNNDCLSSRLA